MHGHVRSCDGHIIRMQHTCIVHMYVLHVTIVYIVSGNYIVVSVHII